MNELLPISSVAVSYVNLRMYLFSYSECVVTDDFLKYGNEIWYQKQATPEGGGGLGAKLERVDLKVGDSVDYRTTVHAGECHRWLDDSFLTET